MDLAKIISVYRKVEKDGLFSKTCEDVLIELYRILGKDENLLSEEYGNLQFDKFFVEKIQEITIEILNSLDEEEKETFIGQLPLYAKIFISSEEEKIKFLENNEDISEELKCLTTISLTNDDEKIELLEKLTDEGYISEIIASLEDEDKKQELAKRLTKDGYIVEIIRSLKSDDKKIELLKRIRR